MVRIEVAMEEVFEALRVRKGYGRGLSWRLFADVWLWLLVLWCLE